MGLSPSVHTNNNNPDVYSNEEIQKRIQNIFANKNKGDEFAMTGTLNWFDSEEKPKIELPLLDIPKKSNYEILNLNRTTGGFNTKPSFVSRMNRYEQYNIANKLHQYQQGGINNEIANELSDFKKIKDYLHADLKQAGGEDNYRELDNEFSELKKIKNFLRKDIESRQSSNMVGGCGCVDEKPNYSATSPLQTNVMKGGAKKDDSSSSDSSTSSLSDEEDDIKKKIIMKKLTNP